MLKLNLHPSAGGAREAQHRADLQRDRRIPQDAPLLQEAAGTSRSVAASVSSSPNTRLPLLPATHAALQKGICYDNEVFVPPDKQPSERAAPAALAAHRMNQHAVPLEDELLADMHCLDYGGDHVDSLLQERLCLPRLNTLKRTHGSNQHISSQQETGRNMTSSSRTASATLSEGDGAGDWPSLADLSCAVWD